MDKEFADVSHNHYLSENMLLFSLLNQRKLSNVLFPFNDMFTLAIPVTCSCWHFAMALCICECGNVNLSKMNVVQLAN